MKSSTFELGLTLNMFSSSFILRQWLLVKYLSSVKCVVRFMMIKTSALVC